MAASPKLDQIATLSAGEVEGWWSVLGKYRAELPGERAALLARGKALGINPAGSKGCAFGARRSRRKVRGQDSEGHAR